MSIKNHGISDIVYSALDGKTAAGSRVYPHVADGEVLPNIVFRRGKWEPIEHGLGYAMKSQVSINVAGPDYEVVQAIMDSVISEMTGCVHERVIAIDVDGGSEDFNADFGYTSEVQFVIKHI